MSAYPIHIRCGGDNLPAHFIYRVANRVELRVDRRLTWLQGYAAAAANHAKAAPCPLRLDPGRARRISGVLAGCTREIRLLPDPGGIRMRISGAGEYRIDAAAQSIEYYGADSVRGELIEEVLLGPPLLAALAARGLWPIHAGAVQTPTGVVLIAGESGSGKSTLASHLHDRHAGRVTRLADDLVHLHLADAGVTAAPAYPQLRLPPETQSPLPDAAVRSVIVLEPAPEGRAPSATTLHGSAKLRAIVANTVAARVFPPALAGAHLAASGAMAARLAVQRIRYPHTPDALAGVADWVAGGAPAGEL